MRTGWLLAVALMAAGAADARPWRRLITQHDKTRLREWRNNWVKALAQARAAGFGPQLAADGPLVEPDAALDHPAPPAGAYRCRLVKLGQSLIEPAPGYVALPWGRCTVGGGRLAMLDGPQRPAGRFYAYQPTRMVMLGGLAVGDEQGPGRYGRDGDRDLLGLVERVGPARWRVALPEPAWQSKLDLLELVPAG